MLRLDRLPGARRARARRRARLLTGALALTLVSSGLLLTGPATEPAAAAPGPGTLLLGERFTGTAVTDPAFIPLAKGSWDPVTGTSVNAGTPGAVLNKPCLTAREQGASGADSVIDGCPTPAPTWTTLPEYGVGDTGAEGWLQLTPPVGYSAGGVLYNRPLPASWGMQLTFEQIQYGGNGADGIGFFLTDGRVDLTELGGDGGSFGYAPRNLEQGVAGGYVGVGLDLWGNFWNPAELRGPMCDNVADWEAANGPDHSLLLPNSVAVRGPGSQGADGRWTEDYCLVDSTRLDPATQPLGAPAPAGPLTATNEVGKVRLVRVTVGPQAPGATHGPALTVEIDFDGDAGPAGFTTVIDVPQLDDVAPPTYKFGLMAATGGLFNTHLVRNLEVSTVDALPELALVKQVHATAGRPTDAPYAVGDVIDYEFLVTNGGSATLHDVTVADPIGLDAPGVTCDVPTTGLDPLASTLCRGRYTLTYDDLDPADPTAPRVLTNTATATASTDPSATAPDVTSDPSSAAVTVVAPVRYEPVLGVVKDGPASAFVGQTGTYTFAVSHAAGSDRSPVSALVVTDDQAGTATYVSGDTNADGRLDHGETWLYEATRTLLAADAPSLTNVVTVTGTTLDGNPLTDPPTDDHTTLVTQASPSLTLTKTAAPTSVATAPATVTYAFTLTNTGDVPLTGVRVDDPMFPGAADVTYTWPGAAGVLAPGEQATATATTSLTQPLFDAGVLTNTATATGEPPAWYPGTDPVSPPATATVAPVHAPRIELTKTGTLTTAGTLPTVGDTIEYGFVVRNTGNVTLTGVGVSDPMPGLPALAYGPWPTTTGVLAPGEQVTARARYTLTQADIDSAGVDNTATVTGTPPTGGPVTGSSTTHVPLGTESGLSVVKRATPGTVGAAGDVVTFGFDVRNTGNVTLTGVTLTDPMPGLSAITTTWPGATGVLAPGEVATGVATYTTTQADVDAGGFSNVATATGTDPDGVERRTTGTADVVAPSAPSVTLVKTGTLDGDAAAGETVRFTFTVTNTGNVTLTGVTVEDRMPGLSAVTYGAWPGVRGTLAPGESVTASATAPLTQADVDAGSVTNTATAVGTPPSGDPVAGTSTTRVPLAPTSGLTLAKTHDVEQGVTAAVGDEVTFTFVVTNTGDVTLSDVTVTDPLPGLSDVRFGAWPGAEGTLAPGGSVTATARYTVTQADHDAAGLTNTATATARTPGGVPVSGSASTDVPLVPAAPGLGLEKSADASDGTVVGDTIVFTLVATNTGTTTLTGVTLTDGLEGLSALEAEWPGTAGALAPGERVTATATYRVTAADADAGTVVNTASVTAVGPDGTTVTADDSVTVAVAADEDELPVTGATAGTLGGAAALLVVAGLVLVVVRRVRMRA